MGIRRREWMIAATTLILRLSFAGASLAQAPAPQTGEALYARHCASCHGSSLEGGGFAPTLKGAPFVAKWLSRPAVLGQTIARMPPTAPGSLGAPAYAALQAYLSEVNGGLLGSAHAPATGRKPPEEAARALPRPPGEDAIARQVAARRAAQLAALTPVTAAMLQHPADEDWLMWRRTYDGLGFSPLKQIDRATVGGLRMAWSWSLPPSRNEITPLVHDGVLFVQAAASVQALDGKTGDLLWEYARPLATPTTRNPKSMAIFEDRLYAATADGHVVALDVRTGEPVWDHEVLAPSKFGPESYSALMINGGPIVADGKVVIGVASGQSVPGGCFIVALDTRTGAEAWRFNTIARPGEPGGDSWNGAPLQERFGAGVWTAGSYDPASNLVFFGTGQTYTTATLIEPQPRKGRSSDALYTDSTLALNASTGKLAWAFQHMNRDVWDQDWVFEQSLLTLPVDGKARELLVTGGKLAIFDALDRRTGKYLFSKDLGLQNLVTGIDPKTGRKQVNPDAEPRRGHSAIICPGPLGVRNWPATAINPQTKVLYVPMVESLCMNFGYAPPSPERTAAGGSDITMPRQIRPGNDGKFGQIAAVDLQTRQVLWSRRDRAPVASSILATGGGLIFEGARDRTFSAYDETTGALLWRTRLDATPGSTPITYSIGGTQYVAVVTGGGGPLDASLDFLTPEISNPPGGGALVVFSLPKTVEP